jgi:hypothetical protein
MGNATVQTKSFNFAVTNNIIHVCYNRIAGKNYARVSISKGITSFSQNTYL